MGLGLLVLLMAGAGAWNWCHKAPAVPSAQYAPAPAIPAARDVKVVTVPGPARIVTLDKPVIVHDLTLPDAIAKDPDKQVTATAQAGPYAGKTDAIAVLDTKTGQAEIELKQEALPFFALEGNREAGVRAGMGLHGPGAAAYLRWTFLRTGSVHWAAYGEAAVPIAGTGATTGAAQSPDGRVMLDVSYRW